MISCFTRYVVPSFLSSLSRRKGIYIPRATLFFRILFFLIGDVGLSLEEEGVHRVGFLDPNGLLKVTARINLGRVDTFSSHH